MSGVAPHRRALAHERLHALVAVWLSAHRHATAARAQSAWGDARLTGWRLHRGEPPLPPFGWRAAGALGEWRVGFGERGTVRVEDRAFRVTGLPQREGDMHTVGIDGCSLRLRAVCTGDAIHAQVGGEEVSLDLQPLHQPAQPSSSSSHGTVRAPMMGIVIAVDAARGQKVAAGDRLAVMESMKMEMAISAPVDGVVAWVGCEARAKVERHQDLFRIESDA